MYEVHSTATRSRARGGSPCPRFQESPLLGEFAFVPQSLQSLETAQIAPTVTRNGADK